MLVLYVTAIVIGLVIAAARTRAPLTPAALGGAIAILGFVSASRILFRIFEPPFGGGTTPAEVHWAAFAALISVM